MIVATRRLIPAIQLRRKRFRGLDPGQTKSEAAIKQELDAQRNS